MEKNNEKNFKCEICEKVFSSNQVKSKHVNNVHGEEQQLVCNKAFGSDNELPKNIKINHHQRE